jgi:hypothetical protein
MQHQLIADFQRAGPFDPSGHAAPPCCRRFEGLAMPGVDFSIAIAGYWQGRFSISTTSVAPLAACNRDGAVHG